MRQRAYVEILSTWEVWRALKRLKLHSAAPRATLTLLSCSPNFPRAQYLDVRTLTHELIVNWMITIDWITQLTNPLNSDLSSGQRYPPFELLGPEGDSEDNYVSFTCIFASKSN